MHGTFHPTGTLHHDVDKTRSATCTRNATVFENMLATFVLARNRVLKLAMVNDCVLVNGFGLGLTIPISNLVAELVVGIKNKARKIKIVIIL